jgi:hypothetical protein
VIRAWLVACLAAGGVSLLAGPGWGLICAAVLTYVMWRDLTAFPRALGRVSAGFAAARRAGDLLRRAAGGLDQSVRDWP